MESSQEKAGEQLTDVEQLVVIVGKIFILQKIQFEVELNTSKQVGLTKNENESSTVFRKT